MAQPAGPVLPAAGGLSASGELLNFTPDVSRGGEVDGELRPGPDAQLAVNGRQMAFDCPLAEEQRIGDVAAARTLRDQHGNAGFARRQPGDRRAWWS